MSQFRQGRATCLHRAYIRFKQDMYYKENSELIKSNTLMR